MSIRSRSDSTGSSAEAHGARASETTLAVKLIAAIVIVSMASTAVFSTIELAREWQLLVTNDENDAQTVVDTNIDSIALAVWNIDERALDVTARSLTRGQSIYRVEVSDDLGKVWNFVRPNTPERTDAEWSRPLFRPGSREAIGTLRVWENYDENRALLKDRVFTLIVAELIKVALLSALMFVILDRTITGPLRRLVQRLRGSAGRPEAFTIERPLFGYRDEIDAVVDAINDSNRDRQRLEAERERRRQYEERASKLEALGRLAGGVAHDFNNVLSVMAGYTEFLREDLPANSKERQYAERLAQCNESAKKLVRQILAFSRNESAALSPISIADALQDIRPMLRSAIPTSTELVYEIDDRLPPVTADSNQITQVLLNLLMNANDVFEGRPGRVVIRAREGTKAGDADPTNSMAVLAFDASKPHVRLEVEDTGPGMSMDVMQRIFEPFFTTKAVGKGTGLGLAIVYNIVKTHGGGLSVRSAPGKGTTFRISLPVSTGDQVREISTNGAVRTAVARRILVVDDEPTIGDMLRIGLGRMGYEVVYHRNPLDAVALIEAGAERFQVVLSDQIMPDMSGIDLIRRIKARNPDVRCILSTGFSESIDAEAARAAGADAFIRKPAAISDLIRLIEEMFEAR
jgi:signal transduction histidine kinase/CheY-like chemotaxis protein